MNVAAETTQPKEKQVGTASVPKDQLKLLKTSFQILAVVLGFVHVWSDRHYLTNADAMSYLDIAEAYLRLDWHAAINTYWSPLYSWLIALAITIFRPSSYWKFTVLHLVNFAVYLFALGCFSFLIREIVRRNQSERVELATAGLVNLPDWTLLALGYSLFIWSSLFLVTVSLESPDMLVSAVVYLAAGLLFRIRRTPSNWLLFALLGAILGIGYLGKSVLLLLAPVFIVIGIFAVGNWRRGLRRAALALSLFVLVASPFVFAMSKAKGRFTTGETRKLNYLWSINDVRNTHWQGEIPGRGHPEHATRKIFDSPLAFEFAEPVAGTYPVWYDPTYWYEGSVSAFDFRQQVQVCLESVTAYYDLFRTSLQYALLVVLATLILMSRRARLFHRDLAQQYILVIPALAGLGIFSLVSVQGRYVAPFVVLLWLSLLAAVRLHLTEDSERFVRAITLVLTASILLTSIASSSREAITTVKGLVRGENPVAHEQWQVAEGLREMGVVPGAEVAFIGDSFRAFWAHLLGIRVVAEIRNDKVVDFWEAEPAVKDELIEAFLRTGVKAIVAERPPPGLDLNHWKRIRQTNYYVYLVNHKN